MLRTGSGRGHRDQEGLGFWGGVEGGGGCTPALSGPGRGVARLAVRTEGRLDDLWSPRAAASRQVESVPGPSSRPDGEQRAQHRAQGGCSERVHFQVWVGWGGTWALPLTQAASKEDQQSGLGWGEARTPPELWQACFDGSVRWLWSWEAYWTPNQRTPHEAWPPIFLPCTAP